MSVAKQPTRNTWKYRNHNKKKTQNQRFSDSQSVQRHLSPCFLLQRTKYKVIILFVVLYGREIRSLNLSEKYRLIIYEKTLLRRIFDSKQKKLQQHEENHETSNTTYDKDISSIKIRWVMAPSTQRGMWCECNILFTDHKEHIPNTKNISPNLKQF
jgi:hypothetical protein